MGTSDANLAGRPTWAEINLDSLIHNFRVMREAWGSDVAIMPAVKADAYGHGAVLCARPLEVAGADWFGVALPEEGLQLREAGIGRPILCLAGFWEGQEELLVERSLTAAIFRLPALEGLDHAARRSGRVVDYHLKIDTGMGRLGVPVPDLSQFLARARKYSNTRLDGVMTHFSSADDSSGVEFTERQASLFADAVALVREHGFSPSWVHGANGAVAHAYPHLRSNLVRIGAVMYGMWRDSTSKAVPPLDWKPVMSLRTKIMLLKTVPPGTPVGYGRAYKTERESRIATLPIGYRDGVRRAFSSLGRVLVRGQYASIVGRVSMDLTTVDVTDVRGVQEGDEVVLIGRQGELEITVEEVAGWGETISYEIACGIGSRVPRMAVSRSG